MVVSFWDVGDLFNRSCHFRPAFFDGLNFFEANVVVLLDEGVEAILDLVLRPARKVLADLRPLAADLAVQFQDLMVFLLAPLLLLYAGVQLVDEPLSDLLAILRAQHLGEELPVLSVFFDQFPDCLIFFRGPYLVVFAQL
jgi:hypothetical protein